MRPATTLPSDVPQYDFKGRKLRVVPSPVLECDEPSPLHEAIAKYLESLP